MSISHSLRYSALLAALLALTGFGSASHDKEFDLLVAAKDNSRASAAKAVQGFGTIVGKDSKTGLYELRLNNGVDSKNAKLSLKSTSKLSVVIGSHADQVDKNNIDSVDDHVVYLERLSGGKEGREEKRERPQLDWWEAYRYWLNDRVDQYGNYDPEWFYRAADHRDQMPAAKIGTSTGLSPMLTSGRWAYVGPHNLDIPYQQYYGFPPLIGRINAIAVDPTDKQVIYIGAANGGVSKTTDGGVTWTPLSDKWKFMYVSSIAIDPKAHNTIYVGTGDFDSNQVGYSVGVMKSTNGGASWANYGATTFNGIEISKIMVDPDNSNIVMATAGRGTQGLSGGVFRSINAGASWAHVAGAAGVTMDDLDVSVPNSSHVRTWWAIGESLPGSNDVPFLKSTNEGATWTPVGVKPFSPYQHSATRLACSKISPTTLYLLDPDTTGAYPPSDDHIWKSTDGGAHWSDVHPNPTFPDSFQFGDYYNWSQDFYDWHIHTSKVANADAVYVGLITIAMSYDGGGHWVDLGITFHPDAKTHNDQHSFDVDPTDPNTVFIGSDAGIFKCVYAPATRTGSFTSLNRNLAITQFYHIAVHPTDETRVMGGTQDNAGPASAGDLNNWINPGAGDGASVAYDPFNPDYAYTGTQGLSINWTVDGWLTNNGDISQSANGFNNEPVAFIPPFVLANKGTAPSNLYAGTNMLWSWNPATQIWTGDIGNKVLTTSFLRVIATCPTDRNRLYTGGNDGQLYTTKNLGASWTRVDHGAFGYVSSSQRGNPVVAICPSSATAVDVLVGISRVGTAGNLYRCTNTGASTPVWTSVSGSGSSGLPQVPVNAIARDFASPTTTWYVGTDVGVFMTTNSGATWANMTNPLDLPNVQVDDLVVNPTTGYLYAGTFGRGMWRIKLINPAHLAVKKVTLTPSSVRGGSTSILTVYLNASAVYGGTVVSLHSSSPNAIVPATATVANGSTAVKVTVTTHGVSAQTTATLTATLGTSKSAVLTITP